MIVVPPFTAASDIEPRYFPASSAADVTVTVKVALPPPTTVAEAGVTASQPVPEADVTASPPVPEASVTVGVMVTLPVQVPLTPTSKVCVAGFVPLSVEKVSPATEGPCSVHTDCCCTVSVTEICCGVPTTLLVTLSIAEMVTVPVYVPGANPVSATPILVLEGVFRPAEPLAGVALSHVPPAGVVAVVAVQFNALAHAPLGLMVTACAAGADCPTPPWKLRAGGVAAIAQSACAAYVTGIDCGLPSAGWPALSVPVMVIAPV